MKTWVRGPFESVWYFAFGKWKYVCPNTVSLGVWCGANFNYAQKMNDMQLAILISYEFKKIPDVKGERV